MSTKAENKTAQNNEKASYLFQFPFFVIINKKSQPPKNKQKTPPKIKKNKTNQTKINNKNKTNPPKPNKQPPLQNRKSLIFVSTDGISIAGLL